MLRGPESLAVLKRVFHPSAVDISKTSLGDKPLEPNAGLQESNQSMENCPKINSDACGVDKFRPACRGSRWWQSYHSTADAIESHESNSSAWQQLRQLPSGSVTGLTVRDPRVTMPQTRYKHQENSKFICVLRFAWLVSCKL